MSDQKTLQFIPRKLPKQARSQDLVAAILEAAGRVLVQEGARKFTAARVAARAGISVGSLYQYFPNKAAILFRLQSDEWQRTIVQWRNIIGDQGAPPLERLRTLVHTFLRSECEEATMRLALNDAVRPFRVLPDGPEEPDDPDDDTSIEMLVRQTCPTLPEASSRLAADLIETTLTAVGEEFSQIPRTEAAIAAYADAMADMFRCYLESLTRDPLRGSETTR